MARRREKREKRRAMKAEWRETARKQAVERAAPERKQVVMQKAVKRMQTRRLPGVALTLFALCLSLLRRNAQSAECHRFGRLPCEYGGCQFSKDASGVLDRTGSCPTQGGGLYLNNQDIKGLREDVFSNMGACGLVLCLVCLHPVLPLSACLPLSLPDACAPAPSLSCGLQTNRFELQQAHRPPCDGVQRPRSCVRREGRERHHRHTHIQTRGQALSACRWGYIPARVARAGCYTATRILTDPLAPAPSLLCAQL